MNNILKIFISLLFFLLLITTAGQEEYASVKSSFFQKSNVTSSYQQTQSPCKKTMDFLFINRFADMLETRATNKQHTFSFIHFTLLACRGLLYLCTTANHYLIL